MKRSAGRILTTHVGSLPRPKDLAGMIMTGAQAGTPEQGAAFDARVSSAVKEVVEKQIAAGVDIVSDGEQGKIGFVNYVKDRLDGFNGKATPFMAADMMEFQATGSGGAATAAAQMQARAREAGEANPAPPNWTPACDGPISYREHDAYKKDLTNFRAALEGKRYEEAFICSITPGNVAQVLANQYYPTREDYLRALGDAMREEYRAIVDAGFVLQLDACDLAMDRHINFKDKTVPEFREVLEGNVAMINYASEGIPTDRIRLHLCWGNYQGPHHRDVELKDILDIVLKVRCGAISFEAANPRHSHEWKVWRDVTVPPDLILIPGVIDTNSSYIEHPEVVSDRIKNFAGIVGPERVIASTDCGFGTFVYLTVPEQLAYAKLKTLAEGAALASKDLF
jgi:5-methyltetrahydropteroyltriglutamate--homocysteine methyltransferase